MRPYLSFRSSRVISVGAALICAILVAVALFGSIRRDRIDVQTQRSSIYSEPLDHLEDLLDDRIVVSRLLRLLQRGAIDEFTLSTKSTAEEWTKISAAIQASAEVDGRIPVVILTGDRSEEEGWVERSSFTNATLPQGLDSVILVGTEWRGAYARIDVNLDYVFHFHLDGENFDFAGKWSPHRARHPKPINRL